jgi:hypothetical protein
LEKIQYEKYNWNFGGNLKVNALLLGLQLATQSIVAFYVNEIVGTENITFKNSGLNKNHLFQDISTMQKQYQGIWSPRMLIVEHFTGTFHRQNIAESHPLLLSVI